LAYQELLVESIDKPLKNSIINNLAPYIVYKDLLDNTFYSDTPKWLIRGTLPRKKSESLALNQIKLMLDIHRITFSKVSSIDYACGSIELQIL